MHFIGVDPGIKNSAIVTHDGGDVYVPENDSKQSFYAYARKFVAHIEHLLLRLDDDSTSYICIERQFDKSKEKKLEQLVTILRYEFSNLSYVKLMVFAPTQLKLYLTGNGRADESLFWTQYQKAVDSGHIHGDTFHPLYGDNINQHVLEAQLMGMMGYAKYQYDNGENHYPKYVQNLLDKLVIS